ncbi:hypothetical protein F8M41_015758 [Gigaspora margarita]|uniref:Uncharacterized protein n=1 Tax=Gigaspora margarita TaxID=4874 RepID=A0A8H4ENB7_GIGMA|nr:hypothetical protein F8M41_015758 [Gigaspora margarita]
MNYVADLSKPINSSFITSAKLPKFYDSANIDFSTSDDSYENTSRKNLENRIQSLEDKIEKQNEEYKRQEKKLKKMEEESKKKHETVRRQSEHLKEKLKSLEEKSERLKEQLKTLTKN